MTRSITLILTLLLTVLLFSLPAEAQTTEITYQGQLQSSSAPASGNFDFEFVLFDGGGSQIGATITRNGVAVANGIFSVSLDFGSSFPGANRFLEIRVRQSGGGAFTTLSPRQSVTSSPYSIKSLTADTATNATTATTAVSAVSATNFTGNLAGDVTGTQSATTVARLQNRNVASTPPLDGQVLKYNGVANQWVPGTDNAGTGGGGGTITGVTAGTGLTGGGATGNVTLNIANGGVQTLQIADSNVTDAKIASVSGSKVTGAVANATNATNATDATQLGGVPANQYLRNNGNGSGLTNLNASSITSGTLANARLGQIPTANIADGAVTSLKIAAGQVVKTLNGLSDSVTLAGSGNITVTPTGNTLTISSSEGGSVGGSGTANTIPVWSNETTVGNSLITQTTSAVQLPNIVQLAQGAQGNSITFGSPNGETGISFAGASRRADIRFNGFGTLTLATGSAGGPPPPALQIDSFGSVFLANAAVVEYTNNTAHIGALSTPLNPDGRLAINLGSGRVGIGTTQPDQKLSVMGNASKPGGGSWAVLSDERLKDVHGRFTTGINAVMKLQPLRYNYKSNNPLRVVNEGEHIGFSAQEVEKLIPEAVTKNDQGYRMVNNDPILWAMLNAVKEQQLQIERQRKQIERQGWQIRSLMRTKSRRR